jgi:hypothetical protein
VLPGDLGRLGKFSSCIFEVYDALSQFAALPKTANDVNAWERKVLFAFSPEFVLGEPPLIRLDPGRDCLHNPFHRYALDSKIARIESSLGHEVIPSGEPILPAQLRPGDFPFVEKRTNVDMAAMFGGEVFDPLDDLIFSHDHVA